MAASKRAKKKRTGDEFSLSRLAHGLRPPLHTSNSYSWSLEQIRTARDEQLRGHFRLPARMAESMRTDDALFAAYENRLAPQRALSVEVVSAPGARGEAVAKEADALFGENGLAISKATRADINGCLANHGFAVGYNVLKPREDGSRVDIEHHYWPIEFVRWNALDRCLMAQCDPTMLPQEEIDAHPEVLQRSTIEVPIVHGDGRWVIYSKHEYEPWKAEACILAAALVWARHAYANRDWAKGSGAHGNAKVVGELPEGFPLTDSEGNLSADAAAFLALLQAIVSPDSPAGIRPAGSKTDYIANSSTAWQVWAELVTNAEKAAARIYLGTDGMLGSVGGAPGVDIATLFGVATTKVLGDLGTIERGTKEGVIAIWTAINFGDSALMPGWRYVMPKPDASRVHEDFAKRQAAFHYDVAAYKANGYVVDQALSDKLAALYDVPAPQIGTAAAPAAGAPSVIPTIPSIKAPPSGEVKPFPAPAPAAKAG